MRSQLFRVLNVSQEPRQRPHESLAQCFGRVSAICRSSGPVEDPAVVIPALSLTC